MNQLLKVKKFLSLVLPESFNVLVKELQALALDMKLEEPTVENFS